jgi:hypothetical protein
MRLMLIGGTTLFGVIVAGVFVAMNQGENPSPLPVAEPAKPVAPVAQAAAVPVAERSNASLLAEAEPLVKKFLEATKVEDLLPIVRHPEVTEPRMRGFYPQGRIEAPGLGEFNSGGSGLTIRGKLVSLAVKTRDFEDRSIALVDTPQGLKIDWESFAGWSEIAWDKFTSSKPATGHVFRVTLSEVDYYNFDFSDDSKWRSYRLLSPDGETSLYGYAPKDSDLDRRIRPDSESKNIPLTLSLKFPPEAKSDRQVEIERLVTEGWVEEEDPQ